MRDFTAMACAGVRFRLLSFNKKSEKKINKKNDLRLTSLS